MAIEIKNLKLEVFKVNGILLIKAHYIRENNDVSPPMRSIDSHSAKEIFSQQEQDQLLAILEKLENSLES